MEHRQDYDMPYLLQYENIAWYHDGVVDVLDRRVYPNEIHKVRCDTYQEVALAIKHMVTQSEGPYLAACHGVVLATYQAIIEKVTDVEQYVTKAIYELTHARPTTTEQMIQVTSYCLEALKIGLRNYVTESELVEQVRQAAVRYANRNYKRYSIIGETMANLIPENGTILTYCYGGTIIGTMLRACKKMGKRIHVICAETRPYFQGARLTASVASEMGFDTTVICDGMAAYTIQQKKVDLFTSASDVITQNGYVINKIGTFQIALACKYLGIPYYVTGTPDPKHKDLDTICIEERNPEDLLICNDRRIVREGVKGYYPSFDITPPECITGIVTEKGIYSTDQLSKYFEDEHDAISE